MNKIAIITNGFFVNQKTEEIRMMLGGGFDSRGAQVVNLRNDECIFCEKLVPLELDKVLFWDKDVLLARRLEQMGLRVVNSSSAIATCDDKALTYIAALEAGLPTPKTLIAPMTFANVGYNDNLDFAEAAVEALGFPMVVKECHGSFGQQVHLASNVAELLSLIKKIAPRPMLFQQYVECRNSDLRLEVVGGKVVAAVKRTSRNGDFRANATLGGRMTRYVPSKEEESLAIAAAKAVGAEIAGVDILPSDKPYLCEVNANAHFKRLTDATGVDVAGIIADYMLKL